MPFVGSLKDVLRPAVARFRNRRDTALHGSCAVLLYHRVIDLSTDPQLLAVGPSNFDTHLSILKEHYHVLSVEGFDHHLLQRKKFPANSVLLTFDDGYADNHVHARPILEKHGMQALFYIATDYIGGNKEFWWDELERLFLLNDHLSENTTYVRDRVRFTFSPSNPLVGQAQETYRNQLQVMRMLLSATRDAILEDLRAMLRSEVPRPAHLPMSVEQLKAFAVSPSVVIGAHTLGHPSLGHLTEEEQQLEIVGSKRELESMMGKTVDYFAYPFGTGADFTTTTERLVEEAGFRHVAANYPGIVHARSPRFKFPRFLVRDWSGPEFHDRLQGFFRT